MTDIRKSVHAMGLVIMGFVMTVTGCGGSGDQKSTAEVTGTVTFNGQPVTGGTLTFVPQASSDNPTPGKPASGKIQSDGTFTLSTYEEEDGAVIGKHAISYGAPAAESSAATDGHGEAAQSPYAGLKPNPATVEIESGSNEIEIKLTK
ncbi:hypothetical protein [Thalassoroseus pseudoceratinae]|uniref:hypothetical protein n=1 Tax=Thalassoroseus pseudoceratinae TaxID=2713176 RepID=UPI00141FA2DB|nr:hypothetical protein [Thalassoroseus pseudoceratinae]